MKKKKEETKKDDIIMLFLAGAILGGIGYIVSNSFNNINKIESLESELKDCEISENYERCAEIKRILDNLKY